MVTRNKGRHKSRSGKKDQFKKNNNGRYHYSY